MNWLVYHVVSGHAFFTGVALVIIAAVASRRSSAISKLMSVWAFLIGAIAIASSSTPIPYWYYALAIAITFAWVISRHLKQWRYWSQPAVIAAWSLAAALEIPYQLTPSLNPAPSRSLTVIGDSVTAGIDGNDSLRRWPSILARQHNVKVYDISHMGETTSSALQRAMDHDIISPVVVLEIGGNDLLGSTSSARFLHDLDGLLAHVSSADRQVIMFELPLPPFHHEYGRIQRVLARKYDVSLVPKRVFLSILAAHDSTLDSIHLSDVGHARMAACVWRLVRSAFDANGSA